MTTTAASGRAHPARIVVIGSYNRDTILAVGHFPAPGETLRANDMRFSHGGKGSNQAVQAARLGAQVSLVAVVGRDGAGEDAARLWRAEGIDDALVHIRDDTPTGCATILVDPAGENLIVVAPGSNDHLAAVIGPKERAAIEPAALALAQLETPMEAIAAAFAAAREHGVPTMLNAAPMPEHMPTSLLALVDILVVNEIEAAMLMRALGVAGEADALLDYVGQALLLTQGSRGATLYSHGHGALFQPAPSIEAIDTTGAGDALIGAFAARLAADGDWAASLRQGVAAGSLACTVSGAVPSFARIDAVASLVERMPPVSTLREPAGVAA